VDFGDLVFLGDLVDFGFFVGDTDGVPVGEPVGESVMMGIISSVGAFVRELELLEDFDDFFNSLRRSC